MVRSRGVSHGEKRRHRSWLREKRNWLGFHYYMVDGPGAIQ